MAAGLFYSSCLQASNNKNGMAAGLFYSSFLQRCFIPLSCSAVLFLFPADVNVSKDHVLLSLPQAKLSGHTKVNCLAENGVFTVNAQAESRME